MHDEGTNGRLHLPDLSIAGFRGIERLSIPRLGRVTLLAGRNGAGKTTVLEAVRVYAGRGRSEVLRELLRAREELAASYLERAEPARPGPGSFRCPDRPRPPLRRNRRRSRYVQPRLAEGGAEPPRAVK